MNLVMTGSLLALVLCSSCMQRKYNEADTESLRAKGSSWRIGVQIQDFRLATNKYVVAGCAWKYDNSERDTTKKIPALSPYPFNASTQTAEGLAGIAAGAGAVVVALEKSATLFATEVGKQSGLVALAVGGSVLIIRGLAQLAATNEQRATIQKAQNDVVLDRTHFDAAVDILKSPNNINRKLGAKCLPKTLTELRALDEQK